MKQDQLAFEMAKFILKHFPLPLSCQDEDPVEAFFKLYLLCLKRLWNPEESETL